MSNQDTKKGDDEKEVQNSKEDQKGEENDKNDEGYFLILKPNEEKIDFQDLNYKSKNKIMPPIIFKNRVEKGEEASLEEIVFKFKNKRKKRK